VGSDIKDNVGAGTKAGHIGGSAGSATTKGSLAGAGAAVGGVAGSTTKVVVVVTTDRIATGTKGGYKEPIISISMATASRSRR